MPDVSGLIHGTAARLMTQRLIATTDALRRVMN